MSAMPDGADFEVFSGGWIVGRVLGVDCLGLFVPKLQKLDFLVGDLPSLRSRRCNTFGLGSFFVGVENGPSDDAAVLADF